MTTSINPARRVLAPRGLCTLVFASIAACSGSVGNPPKAGSDAAVVADAAAGATRCEPTLDSIRSQIFLKSCAKAGCHSGPQGAAALLDLGAESAMGELVNASAGTCDGWMRVVPGNPDASLLWQKVYSDKPPCGGSVMPVGGHLSAIELGCIRDWIRSLPDATVNTTSTTPNGGSGGAGASADGGSSCETCGTMGCVDTTSDPSHCGACGNVCAAGAACHAGVCACGAGLTLCDGTCVDTSTSTAHCGVCGDACPTAGSCTQGHCACPTGLTDCGGACSDTASDPANCGGCGNPCGAGEVCLKGACAAGCGTLTQCGSACVDTAISLLNCGGCGKVCSFGASCAAGQCACPSGASDCGGSCIGTANDPNNCGACSKVCSGGTSCVSGSCECPSGQMLCGGSCIGTQTDARNCGACGKTCGGGQICSSGMCQCTGSTSTSFASAVQPIFNASCAVNGCHAGTAPKQGLTLVAGASYGSLVGVAASECGSSRKRVQPGDPATSYLMDKLLGVNLCSGSQMPKSGQSLPKTEIDAIGAWICAGAQNN